MDLKKRKFFSHDLKILDWLSYKRHFHDCTCSISSTLVALQGQSMCVDYSLLFEALQFSNLHLSLGKGKKVIPLYFSGHCSPGWYWPKQQWWTPCIFSTFSSSVPSMFMLCCCILHKAIFPSLCIPHAFLFKVQSAVGCLSDLQASADVYRICCCNMFV